jgi:hypothetical protein
MTLKDWNEYDRYKRDFLHLARKEKELGTYDNEIIERLKQSYVDPNSERRPLLLGLLTEVEWYLNFRRWKDWIILPLFEGAFWLNEQTVGNTPDLIVAGKYPDRNRKGMFFVEIKSSGQTVENSRWKIGRMQEAIDEICLASDYDVPLFVYYKEEGKWRFQRFWQSYRHF